MSPAPQGNPEVEKYIGSYLISQRIPPGAKSSPAAKRFQNHVKHKGPETEKVRNFNKYCFPQRDHARYAVPPLQGPLPVEYGGSNPYKHPPGAGWAGVPLISMTSGNPRRNKKSPPGTHNGQPHKYHQKQAQQNGFPKCKEADESRVDSDRSPLTRLAIHTQGAPLIQAGRYGGNRCRNGFGRDQTRVFRGDNVRWDVAKDSKVPVGVQSQTRPCGSADSSSVASDESSGNSENSLPRIIKPRKRRKKDRKPLTAPSAADEAHRCPGEVDKTVEPTVKTLLPLCLEHATANCNDPNKDLVSDNILAKSVEEKQSEDLIDAFTSDEFPFGNLLDDDDDEDGELSASATLCQCRYCDPSGVIWDVDQRCYSPFLTPPSPSVLPYNPRYSFDADLGSLLRRSWSDPSSYNRQESSRAADSSSDRGRPGSPSGLQISSEIVTSPNGHRDIEIKFYSSSAPPEPIKSKIGASERCLVVEE